MNMNARWNGGIVAAFAVVAALGLTAAVQAELIDDFSDGDDIGWTHFDGLIGSPWGPTIYDASAGHYTISSTQALPPLPLLVGTGAFWAPSIDDPSFSNGFLTTMIRANNTATNLATAVRFDVVNGNGYLFIADVVLDTIAIVRLDGGAVATLATGTFTMIPGRDYFLEAGALGPDLTLGANLSLKVWAATDPEPTGPQLTATDPSYLVGAFGVIVFNEPGGTGGQLSGRFDDVTFGLTPCPWDIDNNGAVGGTDLTSLLAQWGTDPGGWPDFDGDGSVGILDLLALLANWGPCP